MIDYFYILTKKKEKNGIIEYILKYIIIEYIVFLL